MLSTTVIFVVSLVSLGSAAFQVRSNVAYLNPYKRGGSMLDNTGNGLGEPLNVIISGLSDPNVLTDDGFLNYAGAIGFSTECLGIHIGDPQSANLGDGNGWVNQTYELRDDYGEAGIGSCIESSAGGNHLRMFRQDGPLADSGALFLAVSKEESASEDHVIAPNGYNLGRNELVTAAVGETSYGGVMYSTKAENITSLLGPGSEGIDHGISQDGIVTLLTVAIV